MTYAPYYILGLIAAAMVATFFWRMVGTYIGKNLPITHPLIELATALAYSTVTALSFKLVIWPEGPLEDTSVALRIGVLLAALGVFFLTRRNILIACLMGVIFFIICLYWL